jgi:hypothetical protein
MLVMRIFTTPSLSFPGHYIGHSDFVRKDRGLPLAPNTRNEQVFVSAKMSYILNFI